MTLTNIQTAAANCCAPVLNTAATAAAWMGRNMQAMGRVSLDAGKSIGSGALFLTAKCASFAKAIFSGACMYANLGWQVAKYLGARSWECAKIGGAYGFEKASLLFSKIVSGGSYALGAMANGISAGASAAKCGAIKIASFTKDVCLAAGAGALQGIQITRSFVASHPKELAIAGGCLVIGLAVGYAAARVFNPPAQEIA